MQNHLFLTDVTQCKTFNHVKHPERNGRVAYAEVLSKVAVQSKERTMESYAD